MLKCPNCNNEVIGEMSFVYCPNCLWAGLNTECKTEVI